MSEWATVAAAAVGGLIGAIAGPVGQFVLYKLKTGPQEELNAKRKELLKKMLIPANMPRAKGKVYQVTWRSIKVLSNVIGADEETTKRLLIEVEARGSPTTGRMWAFIEKKPLDQPFAEAMKDDVEDDEEEEDT